MAIIATPGAINADSYVTVEEANGYFFGSKKAAWDAIQTSDKEARLKEATRLLDQFFDWSGSINKDSQQSLRWPREGAYDQDKRLIPDDVVPTAVKQGAFEWALHLQQNGTFDVTTNDLDVLRVGPIRLEFKDGAKGDSFPKFVIDIVSSVGSLKSVSTAGVGQPKLVRT